MPFFTKESCLEGKRNELRHKDMSLKDFLKNSKVCFRTIHVKELCAEDSRSTKQTIIFLKCVRFSRYTADQRTITVHIVWAPGGV